MSVKDTMLLLPTSDSKGVETLMRVIESETSTYNDLDFAVTSITQMMTRLMNLRERVLVRMRKIAPAK